jgi:hypothetical protein
MEVVAATFRCTSQSRQLHSLPGARPFDRAPFSVQRPLRDPARADDEENPE